MIEVNLIAPQFDAVSTLIEPPFGLSLVDMERALDSEHGYRLFQLTELEALCRALLKIEGWLTRVENLTR